MRIGVASAVVVFGCHRVNLQSPIAVNKSQAQRGDPLVMSHLTHGKDDPLFAVSENEQEIHDSAAVRAASTSRKPDFTAVPAGHAEPFAYATDYRWLRGTLGYKSGPNGGWSIRYAKIATVDQHGGELLFDNQPALGFLREGDTVYVEGRLVAMPGGAPPRYHVDSISLAP